MIVFWGSIGAVLALAYWGLMRYIMWREGTKV